MLLGAVSCRNILPGSSTATSSAKIIDVYAASPSTSDAGSLLGGGEWWTNGPTFAQRPLNAASMSGQIHYQVIRRYGNVGTAETWKVVYTEFDSSSAATTVINDIQNNAGAGVSGPNVGDKALYYGQQLTQTSGSQGGAPFETLSIFRVGQFVIESTWDRKDGFPSISQLGKIGTQLVSRLKDALSGRVHGTIIPADDIATLPPPNAAMTLLGAVRLPIQAVPLMLNSPAPTAVVQMFTSLSVTDFVYGDYALDEDTHMEVQTATFKFSSASDAKTIYDAFKGTDTEDANGLVKTYNDSNGPGQYDVTFLSGTFVGLMICRSTAEESNEAASRSCETPIEVVSAAWAGTLGG